MFTGLNSILGCCPTFIRLEKGDHIYNHRLAGDSSSTTLFILKRTGRCLVQIFVVKWIMYARDLLRRFAYPPHGLATGRHVMFSGFRKCCRPAWGIVVSRWLWDTCTVYASRSACWVQLDLKLDLSQNKTHVHYKLQIQSSGPFTVTTDICIPISWRFLTELFTLGWRWIS